MELFDRILLLKQSIVFSATRTDDLLVLAGMLQTEEFVAGETVFDAGDLSEHMYLVENGVVGIYLPQADDQEMEVNRIVGGDCFGEMGLLDGLPRSATARMIEGGSLLSIDRTRLHGLIANHPDLALAMLKSLSLKVRNGDDNLLRERMRLDV